MGEDIVGAVNELKVLAELKRDILDQFQWEQTDLYIEIESSKLRRQ